MSAPEDDDVVEIVLQRFPLRLFERWNERFQDVLREFALITAQAHDEAEGGDDDVPARLVALAEEVTARFGAAAEQAAQARDDAAARGELSLDLVYRLPRGAGALAARLEQVMAEVDFWCREKQMLVLEAPVEFLAFRHWYFGNAVRQCCGYPPVPWSGRLD